MGLVLVLAVLAGLAAGAFAQSSGAADAEGSAAVRPRISVPDFAVRDGVTVRMRDDFMVAFRAAVAQRTRFEVLEGALITPGVAGSLERELTLLIADLDNARYAMSGEVRRDVAGQGVLVSALFVDREEGRATDVLAVPVRPGDVMAGADALAEQVASFVAGVGSLPTGDATLWINSAPTGATVRIDGARVGLTGELDLLNLAPGRYQIEVRREGYVPEIRSVELGSGDARLLTLALTPVSGGSLQVLTTPEAQVFLDEEPQGVSPLSVATVPGTYQLRIERPGFAPLVATVPVRSLRVTRVDEALDPLRAPTIVWTERRGTTVEIDGLPRLEGYAGGVGPGPVGVRIARGDVLVDRVVEVPAGAILLRLDLDSGDLTVLREE